MASRRRTAKKGFPWPGRPVEFRQYSSIQRAKTMRDLTAFGDPVLDYLYEISDPIRTGGKMLGRFAGAVPGGTTANMACAAAKLGLNVALVGRVALGDEGAQHRAALAAAGVTGLLAEVAVPRGTHCVIALNPDGEKTLIYVPMQAPPVASETLREAMAATRFAYVMAADFAKLSAHAGSGPLICVDVDAAAGLSAGQYAGLRDAADVLFINDVGYHKLTGSAPDSAGLCNLIGPRARTLCCTGGAGVTWLLSRQDGRDEVLTRAALPAQVIDTTGAGDIFNAAYLTRIAEGAAPAEALDFAMAAGALATETLGARAAAPSRSAIEARMHLAR
jgi:sugar/nucleoside kinase (ribokinase family)